MNYEVAMKKARATNRNRDRAERKAGWLPVSECPPESQLRTAMEAIRAGMTLEDWECVAEAQAMLEHLWKEHFA